MFCKTCDKRENCKEICPELNNYLERENSKDGYSKRWVRAKEIPLSPKSIETAALKAIGRLRGTRKSEETNIDYYEK